MQNSKKINIREFIKYKLLNSLFLGVSLGSIFTIYSPLEPSIYSLGGIVLAIFTLFIAKLYSKIINIYYFFRISLLVEVVILVFVLYFLFFSYSYMTALLVYVGYQITFIFGSYLVRAETILIQRTQLLSFLDVAKQKGYLIGLALSYIFYKIVENYLGIDNNQDKVYYLHFILLFTEILTIYYLLKAFNKRALI